MDEIDDNKESKTNNLGRWATDLYRNPGLRGNKDGISEGNLELEIVTIDNIYPIQHKMYNFFKIVFQWKNW